MQWVAMRHHAGNGVVDRLQIMHSADARQQKRADLGVADHVNDGFAPLKVGVGGKVAVEARTLRAFAVGHFERIDYGFAHVVGDPAYVPERIQVARGVAAVTQSHLSGVVLLAGIKSSGTSRTSRIDSATRSAVAMVAAVMMSRLPAGNGRRLRLRETLRFSEGGVFQGRNVQRYVFRDNVELQLLLEAIARHLGLCSGRHLDDGGFDQRLISRIGQYEHRVAHDQRRLDRAHHNGRFTLDRAPDQFGNFGGCFSELVNVVTWPGPADLLAIEAMISAQPRPLETPLRPS